MTQLLLIISKNTIININKIIKTIKNKRIKLIYKRINNLTVDKISVYVHL